MNLLLSTVVPVRYERPGLIKCLESVISQLGNNHELIVYDTRDMPTRVPCKHIVQKNQGHYENWNSAIRATSGQWVHLLPDDDWVEPEFYEFVRKALNADVGYIVTGYRNVDSFGNTLFEQTYFDRINIQRANPFHPCSVVMRRCLHELFPYRNVGFLDWDQLLRVAIAGYEFAVVRRVLANQLHRERDIDYDAVAVTIELAELHTDMSAARIVYSECARKQALKYCKEGRRAEAIVTLTAARRLRGGRVA